MIAQPAGATSAAPMVAAALDAAPADASKGAVTDLPGLLAGTDTAPFMLALLALGAAQESSGALSPAASPADANSAGAASADATAPSWPAPLASPAPLALPAPRVLASAPQPGGAPSAFTGSADQKAVGTAMACSAAADAAAPDTGFAAPDTPGPQPAKAPATAAATAMRRGAPVRISASSPQPATGDELPRDLLRTLFAAGAARPVSAGPGRAGAADVDYSPVASATSVSGKATGTSATARARSDQDPPQAPTAAPATPPDPGASLLATVLQWLQQQRDATHDAVAGTDVRGNGREPDGRDMAVQTTTAAIAASGVDAAPAMQSGGRASGVRPEIGFEISAKGTAPAGDALSGALPPGAPPPGVPLPGIALPQAGWSDPPAAPRAPASRAASDELPRPPLAAASDGAAAGASAPGAAVAAANGVDMAAALRAAGAVITAPAERSIAVPIHERHWPAAFATQVLILSSDKLQSATLRLTPEHLGPVEVRIDMHDAQVNVNFTAAHAETRAALEQAMPQLRAVLEGAGLTLGQATVQQQARRESQNSGAPTRPAGAASEPPEAIAAVTRALGIIDEFV